LNIFIQSKFGMASLEPDKLICLALEIL
jgi:hypothetical protein